MDGATRLTSSTESLLGPVGEGGDIRITAASITLADDATVNASANGNPAGDGNAGDIEIRMTDARIQDRAFVISDTETAGDAGTVRIEGASLALADEARISALTTGTGAGGEVIIVLAGSLGADGGSITSETRGAGDAGDIAVAARSVSLAGGAEIAALSSGTGLAGDIEVTALALVDLVQSRITTETVGSDGGNITVRASERVYLDRSEITTSVGDLLGAGGNILIDPIFVILRRSAIVANANEGPGGNILIVTDFLIRDTESTIDASSALGIDGTVTIDSPNEDVGQEVTAIPIDLPAAPALARSECESITRADISSLVFQPLTALPPTASNTPALVLDKHRIPSGPAGSTWRLLACSGSGPLDG
jgi:hypothetical protein